MAVLNSTILERAWIEGSNDFQQRIPNPATNSYANVVENLFAIQNNDLLNGFTGLLNGLNATYVEGKRFENPLRALFKPASRWGNSERHVAIRYLQAHSGRVDDETLLKLEMPEFVEWFYSVGAPRRYEFSWPRYELERAFAQEGYGYEDLLMRTFDQAYSSDAYDEMNIMIQMFAEADARMGLFRERLSAAPTTEATAKELLQKIRAVAGRLKFPTTLYNHIPVPVFESPQTLVLWVTPETLSYIDVMALSAVFQLDKAEIQYRIIEIPEFPIPNVYAALTSEDFIYARDVSYGLEPPFYNPGTRTFKHYLWHSEMIGINPAANCVLFTTDEQTAIPTVTVAPTGLAFTPDAVNVEIGGERQLKIVLNGTVDGGNGAIAVEPDSAIFNVAAVRTVDDGAQAVPLNQRTFVDAYGVLHVQKTGIQAGDVITVTATSTYVNPSGETNVYSATCAATVTAPIVNGAKECAVETDPYITYTDETERVSASE